MSSTVYALSPLAAAIFFGLFAWAGDVPMALLSLMLGPIGMFLAPYLEEK